MMHHPEVGTLELNFEVLAQPDESGHRILMYTADEGSPAAAALLLLPTTSEPATPINESVHLFPQAKRQSPVVPGEVPASLEKIGSWTRSS